MRHYIVIEDAALYIPAEKERMAYSRSVRAGLAGTTLARGADGAQADDGRSDTLEMVVGGGL